MFFVMKGLICNDLSFYFLFILLGRASKLTKLLEPNKMSRKRVDHYKISTFLASSRYLNKTLSSLSNNLILPSIELLDSILQILLIKLQMLRINNIIQILFFNILLKLNKLDHPINISKLLRGQFSVG